MPRSVKYCWKMAYENRGLIKKYLDTDFPQVINATRTHVMGKEDYFSSAWSGLFFAAKKYNPKIGKFSTYAYQWIRQRVIRAFHTDGFISVRCPIYLHAMIEDVRKEHGENFDKEIKRCKNRNITAAYLTGAESIYLDSPRKDDNGDEGGSKDFLICQDGQALKNLAAEESCECLKKAMAQLYGRERKILRMYFGMKGPERNLRQCGKKMKLTCEGIRLIKAGALKKMRRFFARENITKEILEP